ncbi:MAG: ribonuclease Z [Methanospirillum sp.]|uniref:MBL fold metallo-hydrolase n=1 Tax=Methanospirillum sp. TaxID=45200 RepID=UPI00236E1EF9|nr:ribonuclease Z [Methanospirillum sp.]MDD1728517.1 ribonuclease Z [Methanospirillum sp.]
MKPIRITLLGTNGWYSTETGNTLSIFIQTPDLAIILDAGDGIHKIADICPEVQIPACLFLSHFHLDHICGMHALARLRFTHGLTIYGPPGTKELLTRFIGYPFTVPVAELSYQVTIVDLPEGRSELVIPVTTAPLIHTQLVYGYRLELGKIITFCTDTGPCDNFLKLANHADLLISECSYLPGHDTPAWPHMNPEMAITSAETAGAKKLALVHFAADLYTTIEKRRDIKKTVEKADDLIIGEDGMVIEL